ncbi:MAG TPA: hypothetical protein VFT19_11215 [Solirubrobacterales bacterium]|nr:hypothetical protein [Solirubrobacterales bacterium]
MIVRIGSHTFDDVLFDAERDVLYMHKGKPAPAHETIPSARHPGRIEGSAEDLAAALAV